MKNKTQPFQVDSGDSLMQALLTGLTKSQKDYFIQEMKKFDFNDTIPYGIIITVSEAQLIIAFLEKSNVITKHCDKCDGIY